MIETVIIRNFKEWEIFDDQILFYGKVYCFWNSECTNCRSILENFVYGQEPRFLPFL